VLVCVLACVHMVLICVCVCCVCMCVCVLACVHLVCMHATKRNVTTNSQAVPLSLTLVAKAGIHSDVAYILRAHSNSYLVLHAHRNTYCMHTETHIACTQKHILRAHRNTYCMHTESAHRRCAYTHIACTQKHCLCGATQTNAYYLLLSTPKCNSHREQAPSTHVNR
jgi:hypothetical protein